jgi:hypothetical protein
MKSFLTARILTLLFLACFSMSPSAAEERIQVVNEYIEQGSVHPFLLGDLVPGERAFIRVDTVSGSLEPVIAVVEADVEFSRLEELYKIDILDRVGADEEYQILFPRFADRYFSFWKQGGGEQGSLTFAVDSDKDYMLLVFGADSWVAGKHIATFGEYRLQVGVNAPRSIEINAQPVGATIARPIRDLRKSVQEHHGTFSGDGKPISLPLTAIGAGETLFIRVETDDPHINPSVKLRDFGGRLLAHDNIHGSNPTAIVQHAFPIADQASLLEVKGLGQSGQSASGDFRVLLGINAPDVIYGKASSAGRELIRVPLEVKVSLRVDQITSISQKDENFAVVGQLDLFWVDPKLAFNPTDCKCNKKVYKADKFREIASELGIRLPSYIFLNQQGIRHTQEATITIRPNGATRWYERFWVTLQAPDFDLRRLPFDVQNFFVRLGLLETDRHFVFTSDPEFNQVGVHLGEEEWSITGWETSVEQWGMREGHSQFSFMMNAKRHIMYYVVRIFIPLGLLIAVSWVSFFLRDYSKRVDVSAGNLLAFIAFNFTLGSDLPRLGYLTFLDQLMVVAFIFAALMVIYNVILRRLERGGMPERLEILDSMLLWAYPLLFLGCVWVVFEITG